MPFLARTNQTPSERSRFASSQARNAAASGMIKVGTSSRAIRVRSVLPVANPDCSRGCVVQVLLEPVVGVSLVVERSDLLVTSRSVERDRFLERPVRFKSDRRAAQFDGPQLEFLQKLPSDAEPAHRRR